MTSMSTYGKDYVEPSTTKMGRWWSSSFIFEHSAKTYNSFEQKESSGEKKKNNKNANEKTSLVSDHSLNTLKLQRWVLVFSWASVIFSMVTGVIAVFLSVKGNSESLFAYGLDAILDSLSSIAVVWRFHGPGLYSSERERRACIIIGVAFLVSASSLIGRSVYAIIMETHEDKEIELYTIFASICAGGGLILATGKVILGFKVESQALINDSVITYVGAVSCIAGVAGLEIYVNDSQYWYLDSLFGVVLGAFLLIFGLRLLVSSLMSWK